MKIELKSFKPAHSLSEETLAFTATMYCDGKKAAYMKNRGYGEPIQIDWEDSALEKKFSEHVKSQDPYQTEYGGVLESHVMTEDLFLSMLVDDKDKEDWLKKKKRTHVVYTKKGAGEGEYMMVKLRGRNAAERNADRPKTEAFVRETSKNLQEIL
jgi:hypothetical protein